jgi:hypothetical protein
MTTEAYELPPVPMAVAGWRSEDIRIMIDFARAAIQQERERCARICESVNNHDNPMTANDCAAAIRAG